MEPGADRRHHESRLRPRSGLRRRPFPADGVAGEGRHREGLRPLERTWPRQAERHERIAQVAIRVAGPIESPVVSHRRDYHSRVVMVTSQPGMALVREASTTLSKPVSTKAPTPTSAAPMSGLAIRDTRANTSRRAKIACREP